MTLELNNNEVAGLLQEINNALPKIEKEGGQPLKFHLTVLFEKANDALKPFNKLKDELIKEKGTVNEKGEFSIKQITEDGQFTEEFKELLSLVEQKTEITFKKIPISYFEKLTSEEIYPILSKFVDI